MYNENSGNHSSKELGTIKKTTQFSRVWRESPRNELPRRDALKPLSNSETEPVCFASHGSYGVVDLGASKTVIGTKGVQELLEALNPCIRNQCYRTPCVVNFRFGNQGMLTSQWALVIFSESPTSPKGCSSPWQYPISAVECIVAYLGCCH